MCENKYGFSDYKNFRKYCNLSLESNHYKLLSFYHRLNEFRSLVPRTKKTKIRKKNVYKNSTKPYNTLLAIYYKKHNDVIYKKKK